MIHSHGDKSRADTGALITAVAVLDLDVCDSVCYRAVMPIAIVYEDSISYLLILQYYTSAIYIWLLLMVRLSLKSWYQLTISGERRYKVGLA